MICFRSKDYGWQLGQVYITSSTPATRKKVQLPHQMGRQNQGAAPACLKVGNDASGEDLAALDSWVLLLHKEDARSSSRL